jgi:hypothetical protein
MIFASGCSKTSESSSGCKTDAECTMTCGECVLGACKATRTDCCGNKKCEDSENECTCPQDCGKCESKETYIKKSCDNKVCVSAINTDALIRDSQSINVNIGSNIISFILTLDKPFLLGHSKLNIRLKPDKIDSKTEIKVQRIKVYDKAIRGKVVLLAEKDIGQILYTINSEINEDLILELERDSSKKTETLKSKADLNIEVIYDVTTVDASGKKKTTSSSFDRDLKNAVDIIMPPSSECDAEECDDSNPCTSDKCMTINEYEYCVNEYITNRPCCGNKICDPGEDKCSCPGDCGECDHEYGKYIAYKCNPNNMCMPLIKEGVSEEKSKIFTTSSLSDLKYEIRLFYTHPFNVESKFKIQMTLIDKGSSVTDASITSIQLLESSDNLLGELQLNEKISEIGETREYLLEPKLLSIADVEKRIVPKIVINAKYTTPGTRDLKVNLKKETVTLDEVYFIDLG